MFSIFLAIIIFVVGGLIANAFCNALIKSTPEYQERKQKNLTKTAELKYKTKPTTRVTREQQQINVSSKKTRYDKCPYCCNRIGNIKVRQTSTTTDFRCGKCNKNFFKSNDANNQEVFYEKKPTSKEMTRTPIDPLVREFIGNKIEFSGWTYDGEDPFNGGAPMSIDGYHDSLPLHLRTTFDDLQGIEGLLHIECKGRVIFHEKAKWIDGSLILVKPVKLNGENIVINQTHEINSYFIAQ